MATTRQQEQQANGWIVCPPAAVLRPFVEHYWLSLANRDAEHRILPDGCIDIVIESGGADWRGWGYGSTTRPMPVVLAQGRHYLGVRFRPGQARHFIDACASELTDRREDADALVRFALEPIAERVAHAGVFGEIDRRLIDRLGTASPSVNHADRMVREITAAQGVLRMDELARRLGRSPSRLQRMFLETTGVTAKFFAMIVRAQRARALLAAERDAGLADIAARAGYADQSHMTRDFARLTGASPARGRAAFVQDDA
jgi:AraC-like DNA-binding protein